MIKKHTPDDNNGHHDLCSNYKHSSDEELVLLLAEGRQWALVAIYNRYWDKLFLVAANLLDSAEEAEECVQNVFIGLWKRRENLQLTHALSTYLSVAVKYQSLTAMARNQRRRGQVSDEEWADAADVVSPESEFLAKELSQRIEASINRLPSQCRLIFKMRREQDMSVKMIASELNLSENTIKMHLKIANRKLRDDLLAVLPVIITLFGDNNP